MLDKKLRERFDIKVNLWDLETGTSTLLFHIRPYHNVTSEIIVTETHIIAMLQGITYIYDCSEHSINHLDIKTKIAASNDIIAIGVLVYDSSGKTLSNTVDFYDLQGKKLGSLEESSTAPYQVCALPTGQFCCFRSLAIDSTSGGDFYLVDPRSDRLIQQKERINANAHTLQYNPTNGHILGVSYNSTKKQQEIIDINIGLKEKYELELKSSDFGKEIREPGIANIVLRQLGMYSDKLPKQDSSPATDEEHKTDKSKKLDR